MKIRYEIKIRGSLRGPPCEGEKESSRKQAIIARNETRVTQQLDNQDDKSFRVIYAGKVSGDSVRNQNPFT